MIPVDILGYLDDCRMALRDSSPCEVCGHPEPARLYVGSCSECNGEAARLRELIVESTDGYVVTVDRGND